MRIGLTLPIDFLTDNAKCPSDVLWTEMFSTASSCLTYLGDQGVRSIEINKLTESTSPKLIRQAVDVILRSGLEVTFHGWLPQDTRPGEMPGLFEAAETALVGHDITSAIPLTIHGHHVLEPLSQEQATTKTVADLTNFVEAFAGRRSLFVPTLEICRAKLGGPVGVTYSELLAIAGQITSVPLSFCWDMGHSQINHTRQGHLPFPEPEFIKRTIHTHIHDINPDGSTHGPLLGTDGYLKTSLTMLRDGGYQGVYNLELYPLRWSDSLDHKTGLTMSINNLRKMVEN
ncbi:MAG: sugar phosphate isomerase/epimerase [Limnochordia bacterium]|nr:sugar phosphate isomerase/epimerase [Limnochordia bacterium]